MTEDDPLTQTRLQLAKIEGMLTVSLSSHDARLTAAAAQLAQHENRLNEKAKTLARHDERLNDLEEDNSARLGRILGTLGAAVSVLSVLLVIADRLQIGL